MAQRTASWRNSQPWQVLIASGEAKERFRKLIYAEAASGAKHDHDFTTPREYAGVYLDRRREGGFQLYNTLGIARGDKAGYARPALENYNFFGAPHVAFIHTNKPLGIYGANGRLGLCQPDLIGARVDGEEVIAFFDNVPIPEKDSRQRAAHLDARLDLLDRRKLTKEAQPRINLTHQRLAHQDLRNRRRQRRYRSVAPAIENKPALPSQDKRRQALQWCRQIE